MKEFVLDRSGLTPQMIETPTEKLPVYTDETAVLADLANLADGQIGATSDTGSELSAPTDTVQSGNMHAVTSNAVAVAFGEWENVFGNGDIRGIETKNGKYLAFHFQGHSTSYGSTIGWTTGKWVPQNAVYIPFINGAFLVIDTNGSIISYSSQGGNFDLYGDCLIKLD